MPRVEIKIIFCLLLLCVVSRAADLSPEDVFDLLSRRLDDVIVETRGIKSETVNTIESKIEKLEENIANLATNADFEKRIKSFVEKEIMKFKDIAMSFVNEKMNRQKAVGHRMLSIEKTLLRDKIEQFDDKYSTFEANFNSKLTRMNETMDQFMDHVNEINDEHKLDTNFSIMFLKTDFQLKLKDEDRKIEEMNVSFRNVIERTEKELKETIGETSSRVMKGINDSSEAVSNTISDLQSSISRVNSRLNNAESRLSSAESTDSQMSSKLYSIERNQNTQDSNLDSRISQLSSRVSGLGERKVAFSARQSRADSYYVKREKIVFDTVIYSYGGGYSSSTGIFTAPKAGTYLFTYNIQATSSGHAHVVLIIDGKTTTRAMTEGYKENGGNAAVYYLWAGDTAYVRTASLKDRYYIWPYRTTFNGVLIG